MQLQRRNAAHLRLCSKAEESHATLLPRRECACHSRRPHHHAWKSCDARSPPLTGRVVTPKIERSERCASPHPGKGARPTRARTSSCAHAKASRRDLRPPRHEGDGAPKSANPMAPSPLPETAGASRRATRAHLCALPPCAQVSAERGAPLNQAHAYLRRLVGPAGPAFARGAPRAILAPFPVPSPFLRSKSASGDSDRRRLAWT